MNYLCGSARPYNPIQMTSSEKKNTQSFDEEEEEVEKNNAHTSKLYRRKWNWMNEIEQYCFAAADVLTIR